jgi:soluble lytic murein transglycosylase-like protein
MRLCRAPLFAGLCLALGFAFAFPAAASAAQHSIPPTPQAVSAYASVLRQYNPELPDWQSKDLARHLLITAQRYKIDTNMLAAIVTVESSWHTHALSYAGAIGLGQLMPGTAATLGVNPHDPAQNLEGAAIYLRSLLQKFGGNPHRYELVFAAYNAGPKAIAQYGGIPPYGETQHYVLKVLRAWHTLQTQVRIPASALTAFDEPHAADVDYWLSETR